MVTRDQIQSAIELSDDSVIKELYDLTNRQIQMESARQTSIDGKASSLLATTGISMTVALAVIGSALPSLGGKGPGVIVFGVVLAVILLFALFCAAMACWKAYCAIKVTETFRTLNEEDVFAEGALHEIAKYEGERQARAYRQYLMPQLGEIAQNDYSVNDKKATSVKDGQIWYITMLGAVFVTGAVLIAAKLFA